MKRSLPERSTKAMSVAIQMPPLPHKPESGDFDILKSKAAQWLVDQPDIRQAVFNHYKDRAVIIFDKETRMWKGSKTQI